MKIRKEIYIVTIIYFVLFYNKLYTFDSITQENIKQDSSKTEKIGIMLAKVEFGSRASEITLSKVEAALSLAARISGKYYLIPLSIRDSTANELKTGKKEPTAVKVAKELEAGRIYFINVNRLENMLRVEISSVEPDKPKQKSAGIGYGLIHFRQEANDKLLYDPALLKAIQRAFAVVEDDSLMFASAEKKLAVIPAPTLVIGGIDFIDDGNLPPWKLYEKKVVTSFDATEVIFELAKDSPNYVVYDMASRDSIYALFNMHIVENYRPPTSFEMEALQKLDVEYYITGLMKRTVDGANLELYLCKLDDGTLDIIRNETSTIINDSVDDLRQVVTAMTKKLLMLN